MNENVNILRMERASTGNYGYDEGTSYVCPVCGEECDYVIEDKWGDIVGCDCCCTHKYEW